MSGLAWRPNDRAGFEVAYRWRGIGAARLATIQAMFDNKLRLSGMEHDLTKS
jgi:hypothetical protein